MQITTLQTHARRVRLAWLLPAAIALHGSAAMAQEAKFFAANSSDGRILAVTFDPPSTTVVNTDASLRKSLRSLAIRDDGVVGIHLIACDTEAGEVLFYQDSMGDGQVISSASTVNHPARPNGATVDFEGNVFLVSSGKDGEGDSEPSQVWVILHDPACPGGCLPGGYSEPLGLVDDRVEGHTERHDGHDDDNDNDVRAKLLEETLMVRSNAGNLTAGDLLVLASKPAMLLRYPAAAVQAFVAALRAGGPPPDEITPEVFIYPPEACVPASRRFPEPGKPKGMAFSPDGNLLITLEHGDVLIYQPDGNRRSDGDEFVDFATDIGLGIAKITVGPQDGDLWAYVADRKDTHVLRFRIAADGTGELQDSVQGDLEHPIGVAATTSSNAATPPGDDVTVAPSKVMESTFEAVQVEGVTNAKVLVFQDPRESEVTIPPEQPLHRSLLLSEVDASLPAIEIPAYVRSFRRGDPVLGIPTFILILADTTAQFEGLINHLIDEALILGYKPDCRDPQVSAQPRFFWAPDADDPPILEGTRFIDMSVGCGTIRGSTRDFSFFLGARDTRPIPEIARTKLEVLAALVASPSCIEESVREELSRAVHAAMRTFEGGRTVTAIRLMEGFLSLVEQSDDAFVGCGSHLNSELRARATSTIFMLRKAGAEDAADPPHHPRNAK